MGSRCAGLIGFGAGKTLDGAGISITPGETSLDGFSVVMLNSVDGQPLGSPGRHLLTAVSRCANSGMGWNAEGTSVGRQWGSGPTLCEGVPVRIDVADHGGGVRLYGLGPDGTRGSEVAGEAGQRGGVAVSVGPEHRISTQSPADPAAVERKGRRR